MNILEFELLTTSPMFASRDGKTFSLTPQSVRGVMRFWFRAVVPRVIDIHYYNGERKPYIGLKKAEELIFGSTERKSSFDVIVDLISPTNITNNHDYFTFARINKRNRKINYIYGIYGVEEREFLKEKSKLNITFIIKKQPDKLLNIIINLMNLISLVSGFGAKTRKGFGSFKIELIKTNKENSSEIKNSVKNILNELDENLKRYFSSISDTHFKYSQTEFLDIPEFPVLLSDPKTYRVVSTKKSPIKNFSDIYKKLYATEMQESKKGVYIKVKKKLRTLNNTDSFTNALREVEASSKNTIESNIIFYQALMGLPINYKYNITSKKLRNYKGNEYTLTNGERKASPFFFSFHLNEKNEYYVRILMITSKISLNNKIYFEGRRNKLITESPESFEIYNQAMDIFKKEVEKKLTNKGEKK
ncbi:CRISPR type III-B/RAMP module RAMP protein Cmr1 [Marinitoga piezophila KA3]|uniref:CRISPR type III-B/RAMP module RAMP protein Cmr1 n=1 Tax=Marinitoga piezophila (strain DSM 14283 / JCM 11233 / KA3) TaxID=443254 RepID=H2J4S3_MARPK|nr:MULTISPECIES: type III-B CRISPR module RAMP protein Cmr1 [Marinitoga]AEX84858.1 CRISPR type III-B/RAMP module RAMP protein Cmr1 [Marinitoga piezophila KA3]